MKYLGFYKWQVTFFWQIYVVCYCFTPCVAVGSIIAHIIVTANTDTISEVQSTPSCTEDEAEGMEEEGVDADATQSYVSSGMSILAAERGLYGWPK